MTMLDDYVGPLDRGVWEVVIPKEQVTEPLDTGWKRSLVNLPTPGTTASYRKGQYHAHETRTEWKVHLDRYDPEVHPILHLVDDAPLILMIADTFITLVASASSRDRWSTGTALKEQTRTWQVLVLVGCALALTGIWIIANPLLVFGGLVEVFFPFSIMALGIGIARKGVSLHTSTCLSPGSVFLGISVCVLGIVTFLLPLDNFVQLLLVILALWAFGSAWMSFSRVSNGRNAVPGGFFRQVAIGIFSFMLAILILLVPDQMLALLMQVFGLLVVLLGVAVISWGRRLHVIMQPHEKVTA